MYYSILLWIYAACFSTGSFSSASPVRQASKYAAPRQDSSILSQIKGDYARMYSAFSPEKLYLQLDRTLFAPGESVWFAASVCNAGDLKPSTQSEVLYVELQDPRGQALKSYTLRVIKGRVSGVFDISGDLPGGIYKIKAWTRWMLNTGAYFERSITVQNVVLPKLNLKLEFERKAFGPGEKVIARFDAKSLDDKALANRNLHFSAMSKGVEFANGTAQTNAEGRAYVQFMLPEKLESSDALLNITLEHENSTEAISRAIPVTLNKIDLQFFPEGGDAVAGLPCRMAFKALNEHGKPADVSGIITDASGKKVCDFESYHDGMGAFEFQPRSGETYQAWITKPFTGTTAIVLPDIREKGMTLRLQERNAEFLVFEINSNSENMAYFTGIQREKVFFSKEINLKTSHSLKVPIADLHIGAARFTLFNSKEEAVAERLVFIGRDRGLKVDIRSDKSEYLPREAVNLNIRVRDQKGIPVKGAFSLAVCDENQLTFADDKQGKILASLFLEQDLKGQIEEPNFYFDAAEAKSEQALDYLLMTQGWRRFAWEEVLNSPAPVFSFAPELLAFEGWVIDEKGNPITGQKLQFMPYGPILKSDDKGHFIFKGDNFASYSYIRLIEPKSPYRIIDAHGRVFHSGQPYSLRHEKTTDGKTILCGHVSDGSEDMIGASIKILRGGELVKGIVADVEGKYRIALKPGTYTIEVVYNGYETQQASRIQVLAGKLNILDFRLSPVFSQEVNLMTAYGVPKMVKDKASRSQTLSSEQIKNLPTRNLNAIVGMTAASVAIDGGEVGIQKVRANAFKNEMDDIPAALEDQDGVVMNEVVVGRAEAKMARKAPIRSQPTRFEPQRQFYAPKYENAGPVAVRTDFRTTLYWNPSVETDQNGEANVQFYASDAITNFSAILEGISPQGQPGTGKTSFFTQKPLSLSLKLPPFVTTGDTLRLQIALANRTRYNSGGQLDIDVPEYFKLLKNSPENIQLPANSTQNIEAAYLIGQAKNKNSKIQVRFRSPEAFEDSWESFLPTLERGYQLRQVFSGKGEQNMFNLSLESPVEGSVSAVLTAYPSALEDLLKSMERMLNQPSGCFEQVSSSNYPNLMVLDLLRSTNTLRPEVESKAMKLLESGYKQLTAYECKNGGFDWWGRDPAHEGLTAYGLLEFTDMSRVFPVDKALLKRTQEWLLSRRDGNGGWNLNPNSLHGWQNDPVLGAYMAWAVAEAGFTVEFKPEIEKALETAQASKDPYSLALLANALGAAQDQRMEGLIQSLLPKASEKGSWTGTTHSVLHAYGPAFEVETTALVALALMKSGKHTTELQKAINFIIQAKNEYGYGNTQSTVMALKALTQFASQESSQATNGTLVVQVDGKRVAERAYSNKQVNRIEIADLATFFSHNHPKVEVFFEGKNAAIPFDLELRYASLQPRNSPNCPLSFKTALARTQARVGETVRLTSTLSNSTDKVLASPMVILGIPAGLSLQAWQLKKLTEEKRCDFYEIWDGFIVFHFETLPAHESRELALDLRADISGNFEAPASQAFLYYQNEQRVWAKPESVRIW